MKNLTWGLALAVGLLWQTVSFAQTVTLGQVSTLRAKSTNAQSYEWTFPGGVVINGEVVQYTFTEPGPQEVKLRVTDLEGNTNEIIKRILVANNGRPTAIIETRVNGKTATGNIIETTLEDSIELKSASFAVEKTAKDFTELWSVNGRNYSVESLPTVFDKIGTYAVQLAVTDPLNANQKDQTSVQVKINNMPPVIKSLLIQPLGNSQEQFMVGVEAEDPDGTLSSFKFEVLEAGQTMMTQVVESNTTVFDLSRFPGAHTYNFRVTVSDDRFASATYTDDRSVVVDPLNTNTPPEVTLQVLPGNQAYTGETFEFKASATDADNDALKYEWIVSDGRRSSTSAFSLVFNKAGNYSVTLNVSDGLATTTEKLDLIILEPEVIEAINNAPEVEIYGVLPANKAPMNTTFRFYLEATDVDKDRLTYEWDFGNGAKSFTQNAAILYNLPGEYTVSVKVSDGIETVSDEVRVTVEMGPNEIYYQTAEDRMVDLQAEQQRILDAIAANGGEMTPAQQAQLQALNNDIADLIGEARSAGDFGAITQLEQISQSLDNAVGNIEAAVYDGMTLTQLGQQLEAEQAEQITAIEAEAEILAEIQTEIQRDESDRVSGVITEAVQKNENLKTEISDLRASLKQQKADLEASLRSARAAGDLANVNRLNERLEVVNTSIEIAKEETIINQQALMASRSTLEAEKINLESAIEASRTAGNDANVERLNARLAIVNGDIEAAIEENKLLQADISDAREALEEEKITLNDTLRAARNAGDEANAALVEARLEVVNQEIEDATQRNILLQETIIANQDELRNEKAILLEQLQSARATGDSDNADRLQARLDTVNEEIKTAESENQILRTDILNAREALETEKETLLTEINLARANANQANLDRAQARLDVVNAEITEARTATLAIQESVTASRESLETEKADLLGQLTQARADEDAANQARIEARLEVVNAEIETAIADTLIVNESLEASRESLQKEKQTLEASLSQAKSTQNAANATLAEERLAVVNSEILAAISATQALQASVLESQSALETEKLDLLNQIETARATGDSENLNRAMARLQIVNDSIALSTEQTLAIQDSVSASRQSLIDSKFNLETEIKAAKEAGNSANTAAATARLDQVNAQISQANESTLKVQQSLAESRDSLQLEKETLQALLEQARAEGNAQNQALLAVRAAEVDEAIMTANEATMALQSEIEQVRESLETEQQNQLQIIADARAAGDAVNAAQAQVRLNEINAQLSQVEAAQAETQASIEAQRVALEQNKEALYQEYAAAKAAGNAENIERVKNQIIATEKMLASLSSKSSAEYYAEQKAKYEARKTSVELVISEFEKAKNSGQTIEQFTASLQTQADTANPSSDEFKSAAVAIEKQELIQRAEFLGQQIESLEVLAANPKPLPPLGVDRQSNETLPERLNRIEKQADQASIEAQQRQRAAADIAAIQQVEKMEQLRRLQTELQAEQDSSRQTIIAARIAVLEREIAKLEQLKNPNEALSSAEITSRTADLTAAAQKANETVITEQQAFIATRLAELQVEIDLAADPRVKADLEGEKKRLEANLNQTGILTDYEAQLKASQKALNERLATNLNTTAELLVQTQLNAVETKLNNLEKLSEAQANLSSLEATRSSDPEAQAVAFLKEEKEVLELELRELKAQKSRTSDSIELKALEQREAEILNLLNSFPDTNVEQASIDSLKVIEAVDYLKHYRAVESQALSLGLEDEKPAKLALLDAQIKLLNRLNNFGYTPQTLLSTMLIDLQRREGELLTLYREAEGAKAEDLKNRLLVLAEAMDQITGLEKYQIQKSDSVLRATEKLKAAIKATSEAYLQAKTPTDRGVAQQTLNEMRVSELWLNRFYNADKRDTTLGELEAQLRSKIGSDQSEQAVQDLVEMQSIAANLDLAIAARVETDFENFKLNLQKQAAQVSDPDEKAAIESRIKSLNYEDLVDNVTLAKANMFQEMLADLSIKVNSNLFLYADVPLTQYPEPLLFEWDLGDGEKRFGQNISHEYYEPGFYRVLLTMSDGVTSQQDLFTIMVTE